MQHGFQLIITNQLNCYVVFVFNDLLYIDILYNILEPQTCANDYSGVTVNFPRIVQQICPMRWLYEQNVGFLWYLYILGISMHI